VESYFVTLPELFAVFIDALSISRLMQLQILLYNKKKRLNPLYQLDLTIRGSCSNNPDESISLFIFQRKQKGAPWLWGAPAM
jgi:hypothetical protein